MEMQNPQPHAVVDLHGGGELTLLKTLQATYKK